MSNTKPPTINDVICDLRTLYSRATKGVWGEGATACQTESSLGRGVKSKVADFRRSADAAFCDAAHEHVPALLDALDDALAMIAHLTRGEACHE